ncbi:hypothetical protein V2J09_004965 [Rumex salicifolius]
MREYEIVVSNSIPCCRICHEEEEEEESFNSLESPCSCSGTSKFAHRECIQRWCNEKGNTICEICLQKYEPGYTAPSKKAQMEEMVTTSIPRGEDREEEVEDALLDTEFSECSYKSASCCKTMALILTAFLLLRHLLAVLSGEAEDYPFPLLTVLTLKTCGIIAPMYMIIQMIVRTQTRIRMYHHRRLQHLHLIRYTRGNESDQTLHVTIDIQSI